MKAATQKRLIQYIPTPTFLEFHNCPEPVRGMMGHVGSGSSTGCVWEIFRCACLQFPNPIDGVRRTRVLVIRNTFPMLLKTTIPTWLNWFPATKIHWSAPLSGVWEGAHPSGDGTKMEILLEFYALDSDDAARGLKSYEVTMVWANEACFMPWRYLAKAFERVGRFPHPIMLENGEEFKFKSFGMIMDTNPPSDTSWWYDLAEVKKPRGFKFFRQPPAVIKYQEKDGRIWYEFNRGQVPGIPACENLHHNEGEEYYMKQTQDGDHARIQVDLCGEYGTSIDGDPVYPEYNDLLHYAGREIEINWGLPFYLGTDFGRTPSLVICQLSPTNQLRILDEICTVNCGVTQFTKDIVLPKLINEYRMHSVPVFNFADPAGKDKGQTDEKTCIQIMREAGINTVASPVPGNSFVLRRESVSERLRSNAGGQPGLLISSKAKIVRAGFQGRYYYRKLTVADAGEERMALEPEKNMFSHPHDGLQYASYGLTSPSVNSLFSGFRYSPKAKYSGQIVVGPGSRNFTNTGMDMAGYC
jgi:hypothetical protein